MSRRGYFNSFWSDLSTQPCQPGDVQSQFCLSCRLDSRSDSPSHLFLPVRTQWPLVAWATGAAVNKLICAGQLPRPAEGKKSASHKLMHCMCCSATSLSVTVEVVVLQLPNAFLQASGFACRSTGQHHMRATMQQLTPCLVLPACQTPRCSIVCAAGPHCGDAVPDHAGWRWRQCRQPKRHQGHQRPGEGCGTTAVTCVNCLPVLCCYTGCALQCVITFDSPAFSVQP